MAESGRHFSSQHLEPILQRYLDTEPQPVCRLAKAREVNAARPTTLGAADRERAV